MTDFFVNQLFDGLLLTAFPLALLAGLISFLSPCVLPLVPGYLAFAAGFSKSRGRVLLGSTLFVLGFSALFISYGALFGELGSRVSTNEEVITRVLGGFTILMGVIFLGAFPLSAHLFLDFYSVLAGRHVLGQHLQAFKLLHFKSQVRFVGQYSPSATALV